MPFRAGYVICYDERIQRGKFFVFDGIDGSGKATQAKLLVRRLKKAGRRVQTIDFPQYGNKSAGLVEEYLTGRYGEADAVPPYIASVFYAVDRYDASFKIRRWLTEGNIVVADRYITANLGHQGGKLIHHRRAWEHFIRWDQDFEYGMFGIPKPDQGFILKSDPGVSKRLLLGKALDAVKAKKRSSYLKGKKRDLLEANKNHQANALVSFLMLAKKQPKDFTVINCIEDGAMLPPETIHERVWDALKKLL